MSRRPALPGAEELFRRTATPIRPEPVAAAPVSDVSDDDDVIEVPSTGVRPVPISQRRRRSGKGPSGRIRHDEKITVYVSPDELLELEQARLTLRATHGMAVDRGRIVREAIAVIVADLESRGTDSIIVRRLKGL
jgi:hypothetical protein